MTLQSSDPGSLQSYVRHLRHAVATTTCRATVDALQHMLKDAEARLQIDQKRLNASNTKPL
jgi:hypothetical protein